MVFLDTYQRATPGLSSFKDEDQSIILHSLAELTRKHHIAIIILDHLRKTSGQGPKRRSISIEDVKGTGGKAQNADAVILVERLDRQHMAFRSSSKDSDEPIGILLEVTRQYGGDEKFRYAAELNETGRHASKKNEFNRRKLLENMGLNEWVASGDLSKKTGWSRATVGRILKELIAEGLVAPKGKHGKWTKYMLVSPGVKNDA